MSRAVSGKTRVCGIIGDPIGHTMSPAMHNAAFRQMGLDYIYVSFLVKREALGEAIQGVRALGLRGVNVTIPHKVAVIPLLDRVDPLAGEIGAVNTIVNDAGVLSGFNTDGAGFLRALQENGVALAGKRVVVLGAGGAARAICFTLAGRAAHLTILNRRTELEWAIELATRISQSSGMEVTALALDPGNLARALEGADILVNATSVGMAPAAGESPVPSGLLRPGLVVFDAVYNPLETRLLREAAAAVAKTVGGLDMLVWQGALAFEKWTGAKAPAGIMRKEAMRVLIGHED